MTRTTVSEFAKELKKTADSLIEQLSAAGVAKHSASDELTDDDKQKLLSYLKASHGTDAPSRKKITLVKKSTSEIKQADSSGKARTIQVEVRKKRTFVKRDETEQEGSSEAPAVAEAPPAPVIDEAERNRREQEARRQAELIRRQEEEAHMRRQAAEQAAALALAQAQATSRNEHLDDSSTDAVDNTPAANESIPVVDHADQVSNEAQASAQSEVEIAKEQAARKRKAQDEAEAIRAMMSAPKKVLVAKKPEEPAAATTAKGTLHKPAGTAGAEKKSGNDLCLTGCR